MADEFDQIAVDADFEVFGKAATYAPPAPPGGAAVSCVVKFDLRDPGAEPGDGRPRAGQVVLEVRKSEVAGPMKGGVFAVGEKNYTVLDRPRPADSAALVWTMWAL